MSGESNDTLKPSVGCVVVTLIPIAVGLFLIWAAWRGPDKTNSAQWAGLRWSLTLGHAATDGLVVRRESEKGSTRRRSSWPIVRYQVDGREFEVQGISSGSGQSSSGPDLVVGDHVTVLYDPKSPQDAKVGGFSNLYLIPLGLLGAACALILLGSAFLTVMFKKPAISKPAHLNEIP